jgi:hypothetical protein
LAYVRVGERGVKEGEERKTERKEREGGKGMKIKGEEGEKERVRCIDRERKREENGGRL